MPDALSINIAFKQLNWMGYSYLGAAIPSRTGKGEEQVRPGLHALDGSYSELELAWNNLHMKVESAVENQDADVLISPLEKPARPVRVVVEKPCMWGSIYNRGKYRFAHLATPGAIFERFWSKGDVTDIEDMYRRLANVTVQLASAQLKHLTGPAAMLRRLAGTIISGHRSKRRSMTEQTPG